MKMKSVIALMVAVVFLLSFTSLSFAKGAEKAGVVKGTVTKIEDKSVTVQDKMGKETTVDVKDAIGIMVGDKVKIKDGVIKKVESKPGKSEKEKSGY